MNYRYKKNTLYYAVDHAVYIYQNVTIDTRRRLCQDVTIDHAVDYARSRRRLCLAVIQSFSSLIIILSKVKNQNPKNIKKENIYIITTSQIYIFLF